MPNFATALCLIRNCQINLVHSLSLLPTMSPSQRIYGTAWESMAQLKLHKKRIEEAKRRDHRTVGKKLNLFSIQEDAGGGMVFWHPKGSIIRRVIEDYWKDEHVKVRSLLGRKLFQIRNIFHLIMRYVLLILFCIESLFLSIFILVPSFFWC